MKYTLLTDMIDQAIKDISGQNFVPTEKMTDLLLDIRLHLLIEEESAYES
jgi:hypothetical protein